MGVKRNTPRDVAFNRDIKSFDLLNSLKVNLYGVPETICRHRAGGSARA